VRPPAALSESPDALLCVLGCSDSDWFEACSGEVQESHAPPDRKVVWSCWTGFQSDGPIRFTPKGRHRSKSGHGPLQLQFRDCFIQLLLGEALPFDLLRVSEDACLDCTPSRMSRRATPAEGHEDVPTRDDNRYSRYGLPVSHLSRTTIVFGILTS
jgi:hypothetical protein